MDSILAYILPASIGSVCIFSPHSYLDGVKFLVGIRMIRFIASCFEFLGRPGDAACVATSPVINEKFYCKPVCCIQIIPTMRPHQKS